MKSINLPAFDPSRPAHEQFSKHFKTCGINADWSVQAYHLTGQHAPNTTSGDFYLTEAEDLSDGFEVVIRTYANDRTDDQRDGNDLIEVVAEFKNASEAWQWLKDPVAQQFYLLGTEQDMAEARGLAFRGEEVTRLRKGQLVRILAKFCESVEEQSALWEVAEDETQGRASIMTMDREVTQSVERRMVEPVTITVDMLHALTVSAGNIKSLVDSGTLSKHTCEHWLSVVEAAIESVKKPA